MKELSMNEMNYVCGGRYVDPEGRDPDIMFAIACYDGSPIHNALVSKWAEMMYDDNVWTYDTAMAELQAIEPSFQLID